MKQYDYLLASLNNPDFSPGDFKDIAGMSLENTQFASKDLYKNNPKIREQEIFQDKEGNFSDQKFDQYYNNVASSFRDFSTESAIDDYEYSIWDTRRPTGAKIKSINFNLSTVNNPDHIKIGVEGINKVTNSNKSRRELAQDSKIYDPQTGTYLDKSVNDISLFNNPIEYVKSLFGDPLVYATYDEDTVEVDPITGKKVKHQKGEWKLNEDGEYYTEKLNGRNLRGKTVVSSMDYLTDENSALNKIDFFDSDDLQKSTMGVLAKNIASVVPMFIPYVSTAYSGLLVTRELAKSLPMAYGMVASLTGDKNPDSKLANTIAAYGQKFSGSTSDYASESTFNFEVFGNLMSDVALQWGQQRAIVDTFNKLRGGGETALLTAQAKAQKTYIDKANKYIQDSLEGKISKPQLQSYLGTDDPYNIGKLLESGKWAETSLGKASLNKYLPAAEKIIENRNKLAQDISLGYMAIISNTDVYDSILEKGGTPEEAAAIAFGSTLGMYSVDKYLGLGEMFFQKDQARLALRKSARENAELYMAGKKGVTDVSTKGGIIGTIQKGIEVGKRTVDKFSQKYKDGTLGLIGKSIGEGVEEVSEELVTDFTKYLGELAGKLGYFSQTDYGAWEDMGDRYAMSFLGGAAGGAMFGGVEAWKNRNNSTEEFQSELTYLLRQGKKKELLSELKKLKDKGALGSSNLSYDNTTNSDGTTTFITADDQHKSQAQVNYEGLENIINQLDLILNGNQLNLSEDELFDKMVQGEYRANALSDFLKGDNLENVKDVSYISKFQEDFQDISNKIIDEETAIQNLVNSTTDEAKRKSPEYLEKLKGHQQKKQEWIDQKNYLFGEGSLGYVEKTLFAMDTNLSGRFVSLTFNQFIREKTGKSAKDLTPAELESVKKDYDNYKKDKKNELDVAFNLYKQMREQLTPDIQNINDLKLDKAFASLEKIRKADPTNKLLNFNDKLPTESDEEYLSLQSQQEGETEEQYQARLQAHTDAIKKYNIDNQFKWTQEFAENPITSSDFRYFVSKVGALRHEIEDYFLNRTIDGKHWYNLKAPTSSEFFQKELDKQGSDIHELIKNIGINNEDTLREEINKRVHKTASKYINSFYKDDFDTEYSSIIKNLEYIDSLSNEEKELMGVPASYKYNEKSKGLSYADIYASLSKEAYDAYLKAQLDGLDPKEASNANFQEGIEIYEPFVENAKAFRSYMDTLRNNDLDRETQLSSEKISRIRYIVPEEKEKQIKEQESIISKEFFKNFDEFIKIIKNSDQIKTLNSLESTTLVNNPLIPILNKISSFRSNIKVEDLLKDVYDTYSHSETAADFQLNDTQYTNLKQVLEDLDMAEAFLYGAAIQESDGVPIGHNGQINQFIKNHKDVFKNAEELVTINKDDYNTLMQQIQLYKREINEWINKHENNSAQRDIKFIKASKALSSVIQDTFKLNRDAFKISKTVDLLDGYEDLTLDDSLSSVIAVRQLLYKNFMNSGLSVKEVLKSLSPSIFDAKKISELKRAKLDENLTFDKFTQYDKFQLIVSSLVVDPVKYYKKLKEFLDTNGNIAPISIQEYVSNLTYAQQQNPEAINEALAWVKEESGSKLAIADNTTIVEGLGGSGKTFAVAKLNLDTGKDTWLSGPTDSQVTNLKRSLPDGTEKSKQELLDYIFGGKAPDIKTFFNKNEYLPIADIPTVKVKDAPKNIVIDEITHFNTYEIISISKFCKENGINLLLIGDPHQNGAENNIHDNRLLSWKTPELFLSLRNANNTKYNSQVEIVNIIDKIAESAETLGDTLYESQFKNFKLNYYNQDTFNGDIIIKDPKSIIEKIPKDASIGFVGKISTELHKYLKDNGYNVSDVINPTEVQGQEFNYVIVDKDWKFEKEDSWNNTNINIQEFMQDLYTMITRSTQGTILIDNGLSDIIGCQETKFSGVYKGLDQSIQKFREKRIPEISKAIEDNPEITITKPTSSTEKPSDSTDSKDTSDSTDSSDSSADKKSSYKEDTKIIEGGKEEGPDIIESNDEEFKESSDDEKEAGALPEFPISAFSSVSYSGINTATKGKWVNDNNSTTDLGIFVKPGETLKSSEIYSTVFKLTQLKSVFQFGIDNYSLLPNDIKEKFDKDAFDNAKYFIKIEEANDSNRLIGFTEGTGLTNDNRTYKDKVIKLIAKIKDTNDTEYTLSLGGLNRPDTWLKNKDALKAGIKKRIEKIENQIKNGEEPTGDIDKLQKLYENYETEINNYTNFIDNLVTEDQEYELDYSPQFSKNCIIRKLDNFYRLEYMNSSKSPYDNVKPIQIESPIYILTKKDIPGLDPSLKGKAVMFISSNTLLNPNQLKDLYLQQKEENSYDNRQVRMVVLSNVGVSWKSLYDKDYKDLYNVERGNKILTTPMRLRPFAIRMYQAMWNYRADLQRFIERVDELHLTDAQLDELCKFDNETYTKYRGDKSTKEFTEKDYRNACSEEEKEKLQKLWDFNDSLKDYVKQFRLGFESKHGAYIRKLTNIESAFYDDPDKAYGIYINIDIARKQKAIMENMFTYMVDPFIPKINNNTKYLINDILNSESEKGKYKDWYKQLQVTGTVHLNCIDEGGIKQKTSIDIEDQGQLASFAFSMIKASKYMDKQLFTGINDFAASFAEEGLDNPFHITMKKGETTKNLQWYNILEPLRESSVPSDTEGNTYAYSTGLIPYKQDADGNNIGIYDTRLHDLFNLMFHGVISTKKENTFLEDEIRSTAAEFKYGIFSDPVLKTQKGVDPGELEVGETGTSRKLFKCNAVISAPYIQIRLDKKVEAKKSKPKNKVEAPISVVSEAMQLHNNLSNELSKLKIWDTMNDIMHPSDGIESKITTKEDYIASVNEKISNKLQDWIQGNSEIAFEDVLEKINEDGTLVYLSQRFNNVKGIEIPKGSFKIITQEDGHRFKISWDNETEKVSIKDITEKEKKKEEIKEIKEGKGDKKFAPELRNFYNITVLDAFRKIKGFRDIIDKDLIFKDEWENEINTIIPGTGQILEKTERRLVNSLMNKIDDLILSSSEEDQDKIALEEVEKLKNNLYDSLSNCALI